MKITFSFGRNWTNYVKNSADEKALLDAVGSLKAFGTDLAGRIFIDIGCGSGLFSLAALKMGAAKVISFDADPNSVQASLLLREKFRAMNANWEISHGSILDAGLIEKLKGQGDIVYSWGVLHHTGEMHKAVENAAKLVKSGGTFIIAIYNHGPGSLFWKKVKIFYNRYPLLTPLILCLYMLTFGLYTAIRKFRTDPAALKDRGMKLYYNAIDWLGGYPYEYACFDDMRDFVEKIGFKLTLAPTILPCGKNEKPSIRLSNTGCNEFVFIKK
jgi:SAM-dependent methyltransferase